MKQSYMQNPFALSILVGQQEALSKKLKDADWRPRG
jgi:hypothetical protein